MMCNCVTCTAIRCDPLDPLGEGLLYFLHGLTFSSSSIKTFSATLLHLDFGPRSLQTRTCIVEPVEVVKFHHRMM